MKQLLKEAIAVWIIIILMLVLIVVIVGVPSLIFAYAGIGEWQVIICILWLTFCISLIIAFGIIWH